MRWATEKMVPRKSTICGDRVTERNQEDDGMSDFHEVSQVRNIFEQWHERRIALDLPGFSALYAENAVFESPAVITFGDHSDGVLRGRDQIRAYFAIVFGKINASVTDFFRTGEYFTDGKTLIWEYPAKTPKGEQADIVEIMEIKDGLIAAHRVFWGRVGYRTLLAKR
jgi:steroid Delta-isomerase